MAKRKWYSVKDIRMYQFQLLFFSGLAINNLVRMTYRPADWSDGLVLILQGLVIGQQMTLLFAEGMRKMYKGWLAQKDGQFEQMYRLALKLHENYMELRKAYERDVESGEGWKKGGQDAGE